MSDEAKVEDGGVMRVEPMLANAVGEPIEDFFDGGIAPSANPSEAKSPEVRFAKLKRTASAYLSENDCALLEKAYRFAAEVHAGQQRKSGEPFVAHPIEVALILTDLRMDADTLCAALLHDTVEDTDTTVEQVSELFNPQVAQLVQGVTKITRIEVESLTDEQAATIRKMFVAMSKDIRVIVIKLADRLHNMRTLSALKEDRRIFKARETLENLCAHRASFGHRVDQMGARRPVVLLSRPAEIRADQPHGGGKPHGARALPRRCDRAAYGRAR